MPPEGDQEYVRAPVPPDATTETLPFNVPLHVAGAGVAFAVMKVGCVIVVVAVVVHPAASVTVTV